MDRNELIRILLKAEVAGRAELDAVFERPELQDLPAEQAVVRAGVADEWKVCDALARHYRVPLAHVDDLGVAADTVKSIPREIAFNYAVFPAARSGSTVTLVMADPLDVVAEDLVRHITGCSVDRLMAPRSEIMAALETVYGADGGQRKVQTILDKLPETAAVEVTSRDEEADESEPTDEASGSQPVVQLVNAILVEAVDMRASDIHVEPQATCVRVRYRIDGLLRTIVELPRSIKSAVISRFKIISGMDISEKRLPQDGRTRVRMQDRSVDLRVSTLPSFYGEKVVLRILDKSKVLLDLEKLGLLEDDLRGLLEVLDASQGMILITGPTGSGKTATLYSGLSRLNGPEDNIITVEDPVEFQLDGITQVQVHVKAGRTFASALRAILRQDPDVVMVGEIRDLETAEIALQAAQTGHLVLSTLHTNDSPSTVNRLVQMGLPGYLVASTLLCVVAQRLVRRACEACKAEVDAGEALAPYRTLLSGKDLPQRAFAGAGCEDCGFTGYRGRLGVYEILVMTDRLREMVVAGASMGELSDAAREEGMKTMLEDGLRKVDLGMTTIDELMRVVTAERRGGRICRGCQRLLEESFVACPWCEAGAAERCPSCGKAAEAGWRSCPWCRAALREGEGEAVAAPAESPPRRPAEDRRERSAWKPSDRKRILVVEDDEILREAIVTILEQDGTYDVITAENGRVGLQKAHQTRPDLILSDVNMPEMDGIEMLRGLRGRLGTALIPVVMLTTRSAREHELEGLQAGADDYIAKPVEPERLLARVAAVLRRASPRLMEAYLGG